MEMVFAIGVCFVLWLIGSYFIYKKSTGSQTIRRGLFLLLALVGLALIIIKPQYSVALDPEVVHINTSNEAIDVDDSENIFDDVHALLSSDLVHTTSEVHIHGIGLGKAEVDLLEGKKISFHPSDPISGITQLSIPQITERGSWTINGTFQGENIERIYLIGADESIHEGNITANNFKINSVAPVAGSYLLDIHTILTSKDTLKEVLPIKVVHEPTWQMLVLSSYPSFENKYLKNYWTSLGNGFALRSKISKEKYHTSFINAKKKNLDVLTRNILSGYDFIITDGSSWNQLSSDEQSNVKNVVRNKGLALIIRPSKEDITLNNLQTPKWSLPKEIKWKTRGDDVSLNQYGLTPTWRPSKVQGHEVARYTSSGLGHLAVLGIDETYRLILADMETYYQDLWSRIFSDLYRDFSPTSKLMHDQWIWEGAKSTISILSNPEVDAPPILNDSISLPYIDVPFLKGITEVSLWPQRGYNTVSLRDGKDVLKFYAHEQYAWRAVKQKQLLGINVQAANTSTKLSMPTLYEAKPISVFWWYGLCLLGFGLLWLDERLYG